MEDIDSDPDELYSKINKQSPFKQNGCTNVAPVEDTNLDKNDNVAMCKEEQVQPEKHTGSNNHFCFTEMNSFDHICRFKSLGYEV